MDDEVDAIHRDTHPKTTAAIRENPDNADILLNYLSTCRDRLGSCSSWTAADQLSTSALPILMSIR